MSDKLTKVNSGQKKNMLIQCVATTGAQNHVIRDNRQKQDTFATPENECHLSSVGVFFKGFLFKSKFFSTLLYSYVYKYSLRHACTVCG